MVRAPDLGPESRAPVGAVVFLGKTLNYLSATLVLGDNLTKCCEVTGDGLVSHPGGEENITSRFILQLFGSYILQI